MSVLRRTLVLSGVLVLAAAGCGSNSLEGGSTSAPTSAPSSAPSSGGPDLSGSLPPKVKCAGKIVVGVDAATRPTSSCTDGKTVMGMDVDLFNAVAPEVRRQGRLAAGRVRLHHHRCPGRQVRRRRLHRSRSTPSARQQVNMVSYFNAGTLWATAKGNPKEINPDAACGKTVAVQKGTVATRGRHPEGQAKCKADGKPEINSWSRSGRTRRPRPGRRQGRRDARRLPRGLPTRSARPTVSSKSSATSTTRPVRLRGPEGADRVRAGDRRALKALNTAGSYKSTLANWDNQARCDHRLRGQPVS